MAGAVTVRPPDVVVNVSGTNRWFSSKACVGAPVRSRETDAMLAPSGVPTKNAAA